MWKWLVTGGQGREEAGAGSGGKEQGWAPWMAGAGVPEGKGGGEGLASVAEAVQPCRLWS